MADLTRQRGLLTVAINDAKEYLMTESEEGNERENHPINFLGSHSLLLICE